MAITDDQAPPSTFHHLPSPDGAYLCVLASGSAGNCSVLALKRGGITRLCLIDLGLSPRRTFKLLAERGLRPDQIDDCLVTHLDSDHLHPSWRGGRQIPPHVKVWLHDRHAYSAASWGWMDKAWNVREFDGASRFDCDPEVAVRPFMMPHDDLGVAAFRIDFCGTLGGGLGETSLGFATDLGQIHAGLVDHFADKGERPVDVLAIESNYCPVMQHASMRSDALKRRIMGGHGHLSNQEAVSAILQIEPREHVVLLHLSRDCNDPQVVAALHAGADYALTITSQSKPTRWVRIGEGRRTPTHPGLPRGQVQVVAQNLWTIAGAAQS